MKTIIAGSRAIKNYNLLKRVMSALDDVRGIGGVDEITDEFVSGGADGVDQLGIRYAKETGRLYKVFKPDWDKHGKSAGVKRNEEMAKYADALVYIWDGKSKGTQDMVKRALKHGLEVYGVTV